jgi:hypothetical protein
MISWSAHSIPVDFFNLIGANDCVAIYYFWTHLSILDIVHHIAHITQVE